jgi:hypothetical protein
LPISKPVCNRAARRAKTFNNCANNSLARVADLAVAEALAAT